MLYSRFQKAISGEVSEWLKEHAWKACVRQRTRGSNPRLSARIKASGEVPEWLNGAVSKTVVHESVPRVRIPASPPFTVEMRYYYGMMGQALCDSSGLIPPGPEGSNGTRKLLCASQAWPTFTDSYFGELCLTTPWPGNIDQLHLKNL